jgi:hypothetical protein
LDNCLKFFKILLKLLPISQTVGTNTPKRKVLGSTQLIIFAVTASEIFAAARAALKENHFSVKDASDCVHEFLDVVVAFDGEDSLFSVVFATQIHEENELFFFNPWKLKTFLIQNRHFCSEPVHFK